MQLHKQDVVRAAAKLLDDYGIADLTMRRLARELGVTPGALYWHFANKQQLLGAVADHLLAPLQPPSGPWRERVTAVGVALRDALLSHTDGAELVSASFAAGQSSATTRVVGWLAEAATEAGVAAVDSDLAARTVIYYVLGFTVDEQSRLQWDAAGADVPGVWADLESGTAGRRFAFGLALLVDGLSAHAQTHSAEKFE